MVAVSLTTFSVRKVRSYRYGELLFGLLTFEAAAFFLIRFAGSMQFDNFAFFDTGANLTQQYLIRQGLRPTVDFAYIYGLLTLLAGRIWFGVFGLSPEACIAAVPVADLLLIWALVRLAKALKLNLVGIFILALTAPLTIPSNYLHLTHIVEPVLLGHALAYQARGNRGAALALATACVFVKPSMAYLYGLILLAFVLSDGLRRHALWQVLQQAIRPPAIAGLGIAAILVAFFGVLPVLNSTFPLGGIKIYSEGHFGFFQSGRLFWSPPGTSWLYYVTNVAGPWLTATLLLAGAGAVAGYRLLIGTGLQTTRARAEEIVLTCALLQLGFICMFFGNQYSWTYYFYVLAIGLAAATVLSVPWKYLVALVAVSFPLVKVNKLLVERFVMPGTASAAVSPKISPLFDASQGNGFTYRLWSSSAPDPQTAGLWSTSQERAEWSEVLAKIRGHRTVLLEWFGCGDLLFPEFSPPVTALLAPGASSIGDVNRKLAQLRSASMIVIPNWQISILDTSPAIGRQVRRDFEPTWKGDHFVVWSRRSDGAKLWRGSVASTASAAG
ncbi:MAG: hypothetical protein WCA22_01470 [Candidatus Binatus sp.]